MNQLIFLVNLANSVKKKPNQEIPSPFPSQQESKILREIRDSSTKENIHESVIHEPNLSTTTSNE